RLRRWRRQVRERRVGIVAGELRTGPGGVVRCRGLQLDGPAQIGGLRIEIVEQRNGRLVDLGGDHAEARELADQQQRLVGPLEHVGARREDDAVAMQDRRRLGRSGGRPSPRRGRPRPPPPPPPPPAPHPPPPPPP